MVELFTYDYIDMGTQNQLIVLNFVYDFDLYIGGFVVCVFPVSF